jgi:predicted metal-binding membrane protein
MTALALAGWIASALMMHGMASMDGPGQSFLWLWIAMSAAMMLSSLVPSASLAASLGRSGTAFVSGYLAVWTLSGLVTFEVAREFMAPARWLAAGTIVAAAAYQFSPLKRACLRRCRSPLGSLLRHGSFTAGLQHGAVCLGCCWALMLALLALGVGSLFWMAIVAAAIFAEKVGPPGMSSPVALGLLGAATWLVT